MSIRPAVVTATFGMPMKRFFQRKLIGVLAKRRVRPVTWNAGTTLYASQMRVMYARLYPSRKTTFTMLSLLGSLSSITIYHLLLDHYRFGKSQQRRIYLAFPKKIHRRTSFTALDGGRSNNIWPSIYLLPKLKPLGTTNPIQRIQLISACLGIMVARVKLYSQRLRASLPVVESNSTCSAAITKPAP